MNQWRQGDRVELGKPSLPKNLYQKAILIETMPSTDPRNGEYWKVKLDDGSIDYCFEAFLLRSTTKKLTGIDFLD